MAFQKIGVVGAGTMGAGIAQVFAHKGTPVVLYDVSEECLDRGLKGIAKVNTSMWVVLQNCVPLEWFPC